MDTCIFCKIVSGMIPAEKIWENEAVYAFLDINPVTPGHILIAPKRHIDYFFDLPKQEYNTILATAKELEPVLKKVTGAKKIGMMVIGYDVPHAHLHLVPLLAGNEIVPIRAKKTTPQELVTMQQKILTEMKK